MCIPLYFLKNLNKKNIKTPRMVISAMVIFTPISNINFEFTKYNDKNIKLVKYVKIFSSLNNFLAKYIFIFHPLNYLG